MKKPLIGIVARVEYPGGTHKLVLNDEYRRKLISMGADVMMIIPSQLIDYGDVKYEEQKDLSTDEKEMIIRQIKMCDGVLLPGGFKTNLFDMFIIDYLIEHDIPTLGICLGMQQMANYKKEKLWNDKNESEINHFNLDSNEVHVVKIDKKSKLYEIIGKEEIMVNSRHNFHIVGNDLYDNVAYAPDGYVEAIEMKNKKFNIGVQWHPEGMEDGSSNKLFNSFIDACKG